MSRNIETKIDYTNGNRA